MKKTCITFVAILLSSFLTVFGQSPEAINYQGVARDVMGEPLPNTSIGLEFSILQGSPTGTAVYVETHTVSTNNLGLFTLKIGQGTSSSGTFSGLDWATNSYYLKVGMDPTGGTSYTDLGATEMVSVPYALHAKTVTNDAVDDADADPTNEFQNLSVTGTSLSISDGNTVTLQDNVDDADADPMNEIQNLNLTGLNLSISGGNMVTLTDNVNDADANPMNEIQNLSISGNTLSISRGNSVTLPNDGDWTPLASNIYRISGNVGIGTNMPEAHLHVVEPSSFSEAAIIATGAIGPTIGQLAVQGDTSHAGISGFDINGDEIGVLGISAGGSSGDNYGIFGVSNGWAGQFINTSNYSEFVKIGGAAFAMQIVDGNQANGRVLTSDASGYARWQALPPGGDNLGNHSATQNIRLNSRYLSGDGGNEGIAVDATGEVGIGTAAPDAKLHIPQSGSGISDGIRLVSSVSTSNDWYFYVNSSSDFVIRDDAFDVMYFDNGTNRVGINTGSPNASLTVSGSASKTGGGVWAAYSDLRLKRDVQPYNDGLAQLLAIRPVKFKYINEFAASEEPDREYVGVIAQDIQKVAPYMVDSYAYKSPAAATPDPENEDAQVREIPSSNLQEGQELLTYDGSALIYMSVNSIKELHQIIEQQQAQIRALEQRIEQLENK
jgi:hypothetical protein